MIKNKLMDWYILISDSIHICQALRCAVLYIYIYKCSKYQSIPFKNIWVIVRKQNFNLIVDATRPPAIPTNANLLAEIFRWKILLIKSRWYFVNPINTCFLIVWCIPYHDWVTYHGSMFKYRDSILLDSDPNVLWTTGSTTLSIQARI